MEKLTLYDSIKKKVEQERLAKKGEVSTAPPRKKHLDKNLVFKDGKIYYNNIECGKYNDDNRTIELDQQKCLNYKGLNPLTSHPSLPTNAKITIIDRENKHTIETDYLGRKTKLTNELNRVYEKNIGQRATDEQTNAKLFGDEEGVMWIRIQN